MPLWFITPIPQRTSAARGTALNGKSHCPHFAFTLARFLKREGAWLEANWFQTIQTKIKQTRVLKVWSGKHFTSSQILMPTPPPKPLPSRFSSQQTTISVSFDVFNVISRREEGASTVWSRNISILWSLPSIVSLLPVSFLFTILCLWTHIIRILKKLISLTAENRRSCSCGFSDLLLRKSIAIHNCYSGQAKADAIIPNDGTANNLEIAIRLIVSRIKEEICGRSESFQQEFEDDCS